MNTRHKKSTDYLYNMDKDMKDGNYIPITKMIARLMVGDEGQYTDEFDSSNVVEWLEERLHDLTPDICEHLLYYKEDVDNGLPVQIGDYDEEVVAATPSQIDYSTYKLVELKEAAKNLGLQGFSTMTKAQLIEWLTKHGNAEEKFNDEWDGA